MLQFILGKSGTGKSYCIRKTLMQLIDDKETNNILLVPDQSSFEVEKLILEQFGAKRASCVNVVGFSRLCTIAFEKVGYVYDNLIDDGTRAILMNITLDELQDKITLFKGKNNNSVTQLLLNTLSDCKNNDITPDKLRQAIGNVNGQTLISKLKDTSLILETFNSILNQSYIDPLDNPTKLVNILQNNNLFANYNIFVDSFTGFNQVQQKVIRCLLNQCKNMFVALSLDFESIEKNTVFATTNATYKKIIRFAKSDDIQIKSPIILSENKRFINNDLITLEKGLYRQDIESCEDIPKNILIYNAKDKYAECEYVCQNINRLIIDENYSFSDINIICRNTENYHSVLSNLLKKYKIPYFLDEKNDILVKPLIKFVVLIFRLLINNFERQDFLSLLKTGLTDFNIKDISIFENYVYMWNCNRADFKKEFTKNPSGFKENLTSNDETNLSVCNKIREKVVDALLNFKEKSKSVDCKTITENLYNLLIEFNIDKNIKSIAKQQDNNNLNTNNEEIKIWNMFVLMLDNNVAAIGNRTLSIEKYYELLSLQLKYINYSEVPQTMDCVTITNAQRARNSNQKVSFVIGCVDGVFPAIPHYLGVFSQYELNLLISDELPLSDRVQDTVALEKFMAYNALTSPSEKLFISYYSTNYADEPYIPSSIIGECQKIFKNIIEYDKNDYNSDKESFWSESSAFETLAKKYILNKNNNSDLYNYFICNDKFKNKLSAIDRTVTSKSFKIEHKKNIEKLFGENLNVSASQIEKFSYCKFSYFCNYGLNVKTRKKAEINSMEYGTLIHYVLQQFFTTYKKEQFTKLTDIEIDKYINLIINDYFIKVIHLSEDELNKCSFQIKTISENVKILIAHIIEELTQSDFIVEKCELDIKNDIKPYTVSLPTGQKIAVSGSIDRVDVMQTDGEKYVRIIDYKTGKKEFCLSDILYGLNLQMLLYLYAIVNSDSKLIPAGILYMPAKIRDISSNIICSNEVTNDKIQSNLKMNGLLLSNEKSIIGMDKTNEQTYIPACIKLNVPSSKKSLATLEEFGKIFKKIDSTVLNMGTCLYGGHIEALPLSGAHNSCEYCDYSDVCIYRKNESKNTFTQNNEDVFKIISEEVDN